MPPPEWKCPETRLFGFGENSPIQSIYKFPVVDELIRLELDHWWVLNYKDSLHGIKTLWREQWLNMPEDCLFLSNPLNSEYCKAPELLEALKGLQVGDLTLIPDHPNNFFEWVKPFQYYEPPKPKPPVKKPRKKRA